MKNGSSTDRGIINGTGYLTGALIGIVAAVAAFVLTEEISISIALMAGLSIPVGLAIERKLQAETDERKKHSHKLMITLIITGVLFFFSLIFITSFI
jgi:dipeptide/tripeptide permease